MFSAYAKFWKGYVDFEGRSTRSEFWFAFLANFLIYIALYILVIVGAAIGGASSYATGDTSGASFAMAGIFGFLLMIFILAIILPTLAIEVRRLRDAGFHWAFIFLHFAFGLGSIALLIMFCQPTKVEVPFNNNFNNPNQP